MKNKSELCGREHIFLYKNIDLYKENFGWLMKYLFDMGEVWHVYADVGNEWIYYRMEQVAEEALSKNGDTLPGPLGRLDAIKELELEHKSLNEMKERLQQYKENAAREKEEARTEFEKSYKELMKMAEELQKEGKLWRQRYLDLAYQVSPKGKT